MDERIVQFRVGVFVLAALIVGGILVLLFGEVPTLVRDYYTVYVVFQSAPGVSVDTPVRQYGVLIGRVVEVEILEDAGALVTTRINSRYRLSKTLTCKIGGSLLGDAVLEFVPSGKVDKVKEYLQDGDRILGISRTDPLEVISNLENSLAEAIGSVARTSTEIGEVARRVTDLLDANDEQITRIVGKTEQAIDRLQAAAGSLNELLADPEVQSDLKRSIKELPEVLAQARQAIDGFQSAMDRVDRNLKNLEGLSEPLGERGPELVANLERAARKLDVVLTDMSAFSERLQDPDSSLGRLLNSPEMYDKVYAAISNVEQLTRDLRPILRDARAFTDKIARHPEVIGVGGLLRRSSGIK